MHSECVRGLGGLSYLGTPRPFPLLNSSARNLSIKISIPECSGNLRGLQPHLARGDPSRRDREGIPSGVFARQPMDPWKDSTLSNCTASPGQDDGPQDQKPLGDSAPFPAAGVPFPACSLRRSRCAVPEQSARSQAPGEEDARAPGSVELSRRIPKSDMSIELVMPSNHLMLCHPLLLLSSIFPLESACFPYYAWGCQYPFVLCIHPHIFA